MKKTGAYVEEAAPVLQVFQGQRHPGAVRSVDEHHHKVFDRMEIIVVFCRQRGVFVISGIVYASLEGVHQSCCGGAPASGFLEVVACFGCGLVAADQTCNTDVTVREANGLHL